VAVQDASRVARHSGNRLNRRGFAVAGLTLRRSTLFRQPTGRRFSNTLWFGG